MTTTGPQPAPRPAPALRDRSAAGFVWFLLQTGASKGVSLLGQIALAWLLLPDDFGLVGLAFTVTTFTALIQKFGMREVLIRRQARFHLWSGPAFGLSVASGCAGGLVAAALAPLAAALYDEPRVTGLILVLALANPFRSMAIPSLTRLEVDLRFRTIATLNFLSTFGTIALSVLFAALGFGAFSFVLPRLVIAIAELGAAWRLAPVSTRGAMRFARWKYMVRDSLALFLSQLFGNATYQGDYFLLGLAAGKAVVGLYFFAFSLSMQTAMLFSLALSKVLLPSLAVLRTNPKRQIDAALEAVGLLAFITTPVCLLQAVLAGPAIRLLFEERWLGAIPLLQILSVGMAVTTATIPTDNLILAQGRFRARTWFTACSAAFFFLVATPAAFLFGVEGVAVAVVIHRVFYAPAQMVLAVRSVRRGLRSFARVNGRPLLAGAAGAGVAYACIELLPDGTIWDGVRLALGPTILGAVYLAIAWPLMPDCRRMLAERLGVMRRSVARRGSAAPVQGGGALGAPHG